MSQTPITVVSGLVAWMDPENMALIRHVGTSMSTVELMSMFDLDRERFPDLADTSRLQLFEITGRVKERFIRQVVDHADSIQQEPSRIDPDEYVDLLNQSVLLEPCYRSEDEEWVTLTNKDKAYPDSNRRPDTPLGWFVNIKVKE